MEQRVHHLPFGANADAVHHVNQEDSAAIRPPGAKAADLCRPNARFTPERQGYQVLTPFGKLGYRPGRRDGRQRDRPVPGPGTDVLGVLMVGRRLDGRVVRSVDLPFLEALGAAAGLALARLQLLDAPGAGSGEAPAAEACPVYRSVTEAGAPPGCAGGLAYIATEVPMSPQRGAGRPHPPAMGASSEYASISTRCTFSSSQSTKNGRATPVASSGRWSAMLAYRAAIFRSASRWKAANSI